MNKKSHKFQKKAIDILSEAKDNMQAGYTWTVENFAKEYKEDYLGKEVEAQEAIKLFKEERDEAMSFGEEEYQTFKEKHPLLDKLYPFVEYYQEGIEKIDLALEDVYTNAFLDGNDDLLEK